MSNLLFKRKKPGTCLCGCCGDIAVVANSRNWHGDTLCAKDKHWNSGIVFPDPSLSVAIEPKSKGDEDKLGSALARLAEEDPTIKVEKNLETRELILKGIGETHLEILQEKLQRKFGVAVNTRVPRVPYRETIRKEIKVEGKHKKQSGGHGQYGHVWITMEPTDQGEFEFAEHVFGGAVPKNYFRQLRRVSGKRCLKEYLPVTR